MGIQMKNHLIISVLLFSSGFTQNSGDSVIFFQNENYIGDLIAGKKEGKGTFTYPNGDTYIGEFKNNLFHGQGILYFTGGERYEGEWINGKKRRSGDLFLSLWKNL